MSTESIEQNLSEEHDRHRSHPKPKLHKLAQEIQENSQQRQKLPSLEKMKKYSCSSKDFHISNTCQLHHFLREKNPNRNMKKFLNKIQKNKKIDTTFETQNRQTDLLSKKRQLFYKRSLKTITFDKQELRKYSSCNKITSFPSIKEIQLANQYRINKNEEELDVRSEVQKLPEREIKSSNSIKLTEAPSLIKKLPKSTTFQSFRKLIKSSLNKNSKIGSENSIQIENQQKNKENLSQTRKSKIFQIRQKREEDKKVKVLVKNPFHRLQRKMKHQSSIKLNTQNSFNDENICLSNIFEDVQESEISIGGKNEIENLIYFIQ